MKKTIMGILGLTLVAQSGFATSPRLASTRLEAEKVPYGRLVGGTTARVRIFAHGVVYGEKFVGGRKVFAGNIDTLSVRKMTKIEDLIEDAAEGEIVYPKPGRIHCMAVPTQTRTYKADNGKVLLRSATTPCGGTTFNNTVAAEDLVKILEKYLSEVEDTQADDLMAAAE